MLTTHDSFAVGTVAIFAIFFIYNALTLKKVNKDAPGFLITLGIAFTFFGIAMGLRKFDINDPNASIGTLIDGIKTVFWGSFAGVFSAIILRMINAFLIYKSNSQERDEIITNNYLAEHSELVQLNKGNYGLLGQVNHNLEQNNKHLLQGLEQLGMSFSEYSKNNLQNTLEQILPILQRLEDSQAKSHTTFVVEELRTLRYSFDKFSEQQAEQNTKIFIEALEKAIYQFNEQLATQLGENFRELNQAVFKLTNWQDNYSKHVESQTVAYQNMLGYVEKTQVQFEEFISKASSFNDIAKSLDNTLNELQNRQEIIEKHLQTFYEELNTKAVEIGELRNIINESFESIKEIHIEHKEQILDLGKNTAQYVNKIAEKQGEFAKKTTDNIQSLQSKVSHEFIETEKKLEEQMLMMQKHHENALNASLQSLARQLASLSAQFAKDYEPITTNLRKIMQLGSRN